MKSTRRSDISAVQAGYRYAARRAPVSTNEPKAVKQAPGVWSRRHGLWYRLGACRRADVALLSMLDRTTRNGCPHGTWVLSAKHASSLIATLAVGSGPCIPVKVSGLRLTSDRDRYSDQGLSYRPCPHCVAACGRFCREVSLMVILLPVIHHSWF